jgi:hypothetical protein
MGTTRHHCVDRHYRRRRRFLVALDQVLVEERQVALVAQEAPLCASCRPCHP